VRQQHSQLDLVSTTQLLAYSLAKEMYFKVLFLVGIVFGTCYSADVEFSSKFITLFHCCQLSVLFRHAHVFCSVETTALNRFLRSQTELSAYFSVSVCSYFLFKLLSRVKVFFFLALHLLAIK